MYLLKRTLALNIECCCYSSVSSSSITIACLENHPPTQFRPTIPRRPSLNRVLATNHLLITSQVHHHSHQETTQSKARPVDTENDHDEGIDSAIESRSLSINTSDDGLVEVIIRTRFYLQCFDEISFRTIPKHRNDLFDQYIAVPHDEKSTEYLATEVI